VNIINQILREAVILEKLIVSHVVKESQVVWNTEVLYRSHKSASLVRSLNQIKPTHTLIP
jgi:hypothetical protein